MGTHVCLYTHTPLRAQHMHAIQVGHFQDPHNGLYCQNILFARLPRWSRASAQEVLEAFRLVGSVVWVEPSLDDGTNGFLVHLGPDAAWTAGNMIQRFHGKANLEGEDLVQDTMPIHERLAGAVIGQGGCNLREIKSTSGAHVEVSPWAGANATRFVTIIGTSRAVHAARLAVNQSGQDAARRQAAQQSSSTTTASAAHLLPNNLLLEQPLNEKPLNTIWSTEEFPPLCGGEKSPSPSLPSPPPSPNVQPVASAPSPAASPLASPALAQPQPSPAPMMLPPQQQQQQQMQPLMLHQHQPPPAMLMMQQQQQQQQQPVPMALTSKNLAAHQAALRHQPPPMANTSPFINTIAMAPPPAPEQAPVQAAAAAVTKPSTLSLTRKGSARSLVHLPHARWCTLKDRISLVGAVKKVKADESILRMLHDIRVLKHSMYSDASELEAQAEQKKGVKFGVRSKSCFDFADIAARRAGPRAQQGVKQVSVTA